MKLRGEVLVTIIVCILAAVALAVIVTAALGERPGDTVQLYGIFRDSDGVAVVPTGGRMFVFKDGAVIDSSTVFAPDSARYHRVVTWEYTIPASDADSSEYAFFMKASDATITDDWFPCEPSRVTIRPSVVDTLAPAAVVDLFAGEVDLSFALVDSTDAGGIYTSGGDPVTGAFVFVTLESNMTQIVGFGKSTLGNYKVWTPLDPVLPDTLYMSAWYQNAWLESSVVFYK